MRKLTTAFLALLAAALSGPLPASAQNNLFPQTLPANVVVGRLGIGPGPAQAIPFGTLFGNLFNGGSAPTAHCLLVGEGASPIGTACPSLAGNLFIDQGASLDPASKTLSGDATLGSTGTFTIAAGAVTGAKIAANTVGVANLFQPGANTTLCNPTGSTANWQACTPGQMSANLCAPNIQVFTSGTAQTYTVPTCNSVLASYLEIEMVGGGGGGAGTGTSGGNGTTGNASTFVFNAVTYTAGGGVNGTNGSLQAGGAGGAVTGCDDNIVGGTAGFGYGGSATTAFGVYGAGSVYGGAGGSGDVSNPGNSGATNTGGGGGVGGSSASVVGGSPGGSGGFCRKLIAVGAVTTGTYTVGAVANGGGGGTSGQSGGNGAAGRLKVTARWQ